MASKFLLMFLQEWLDWAETGAPINHKCFVHSGLCTNLDYWCRDKFGAGNLSYLLIDKKLAQLLNELNKEKEAIYPFNPVVGSYTFEACTLTTHLNPKRVQWAKETITKLQEQGQ